MSKRTQKDATNFAARVEAAERSSAMSSGEAPEIGPEDFYFEGPYMVFTTAYHLKRGYCCNSDCRHCPYK